jgi:16S rRNA (guanine1207-N2)-methyltransferase
VADAATAVMIGCLDALGPMACPLVVDERSGALARAIVARGATPVEWLRQAVAGGRTAPASWPAAMARDAALIRLPKAKEALELALHAAAAGLEPGGLIAVFGANDEGIRSAASRLAIVAEDVATLATRRHARVLAGRRRAAIEGLRSRLDDWRRVGEIELPGARHAWVSYPGTFAKGGLDQGTALLLAHLPEVAAGARVLDFAAGTGVIGRALLARSSEAAVDLLEADVIALEAARENVPGARRLAGTCLADAGPGRYDLILSNPPLHEGVAESHTVLDRLIAEAPTHLARGGELRLVVQRRVSVLDALRASFREAAIIADDGRFTVAAGRL